MNLPEYERPPVREVVLGVHFEPVPRLGGPHLGLLWQEFRQTYGKIEEKPPLSFSIERFGIPVPPAPQFGLELLDTLPPRVWFLDETEHELLQVQQDWFSHNWRKLREGNEYPRYKNIRQSFHGELSVLLEFLKRENLGDFKPLQCEVSYVNLIPAALGATLGDILTVFNSTPGDSFLPEPESASVAMRFIIPGKGGNPVGRLHVGAVPVVNTASSASGHQVTLTVRGKPEGGDIGSIFAFMDQGHDWIVQGFTAITTAKMHEHWGRTQ